VKGPTLIGFQVGPAWFHSSAGRWGRREPH